MDELIAEFKMVYVEKGASDLKSQVTYLAQLAEFYHRKGESNSDWVSLLKAHSLYNSAAARDRENGEEWAEKAFNVQTSYWGEAVSVPYENQRKITYAVKKALTEIRQATKQRLDQIKQNYINFNCEPDQIFNEENKELYEKFICRVEQVTQRCSTDMVEVFKHIIQKSVEMVGDPPCGLSVVAIGSLARGEATPYSDLEFMFLIETKSKRITKYFERLALTIYFQIGNLQETKLKYMAIEELSGWFDDVSTNGLKIDGLQPSAGNIPTGNGAREQHNHLICTVGEMVSRYKHIYDYPDPEKSKCGDLTAVLFHTVLLYQYGEVDLHLKFRSAIRGMKPNETRKEASEKMLKSDIKKFNVNLDFKLAQILNLKSDIYRFPSLVIFNLGIIFKIEEKPSNVPKCLTELQYFSNHRARCLQFIYFCALYVRLSTYLHHGSQNEKVSVLKASPNCAATADTGYIERPLLIHMVICLMFVKGQIEEQPSKEKICDIIVILSLICEDYQICYDILQTVTTSSVGLLKPILNTLFGQFDEAEKGLLSLANSEHISLCLSKEGELANTCNIFQKVNAIMEQFSWSPAEQGSVGTDDNLFCSRRVSILAVCIRIIRSIPHVVKCSTCRTLYQPAYALISKVIKSSYLNPILMNLLGSLWDDYLKLLQGCKLSEAESVLEKSLQGLLERYGHSRSHSFIAFNYIALGSVYRLQQKHEQALKNLTEGHQMLTKILPEIGAWVLPIISSVIGEIYFEQGKYTSSVEKLISSLKAFHSSNKMAILDLEATYAFLVHAQLNLGQYEEAETSLTKLVELQLIRLGGPKHPKVALCYFSLGRITEEAGKYTKAEQNYSKSLEIYTGLLDGSGHFMIAECYHGLMTVAEAQNQHRQALRYYHKYFSEHFRRLQRLVLERMQLPYSVSKTVALPTKNTQPQTFCAIL